MSVISQTNIDPEAYNSPHDNLQCTLWPSAAWNYLAGIYHVCTSDVTNKLELGRMQRGWRGELFFMRPLNSHFDVRNMVFLAIYIMKTRQRCTQRLSTLLLDRVWLAFTHFFPTKRHFERSVCSGLNYTLKANPSYSLSSLSPSCLAKDLKRRGHNFNFVENHYVFRNIDVL